MSEFPDLRKMISGFAVDATKWVAAGAPILDKNFANKRMQICAECEHLKTGRCTKCGCYMLAKTKLATATCPEGKW